MHFRKNSFCSDILVLNNMLLKSRETSFSFQPICWSEKKSFPAMPGHWWTVMEVWLKTFITNEKKLKKKEKPGVGNIRIIKKTWHNWNSRDWKGLINNSEIWRFPKLFSPYMVFYVAIICHPQQQVQLYHSAKGNVWVLTDCLQSRGSGVNFSRFRTTTNFWWTVDLGHFYDGYLRHGVVWW